MSNSFSMDRFRKMPLVGIMRDVPEEAMNMLAGLYLESGLTTLEITMNSKGAVNTLARLTAQYGAALNIGAGTVLTSEELDMALLAGAQFIVTPVLNDAVIKRCVKKGIPVFPGAYTPTEIYKAWEMGASMVKVFPASRLGADYIKEVMAPMRFLKLLPTGGVTLNNCLDFFEKGAAGVALGSSLFPKELIQNEKWNEIKGLFRQFHDCIESHDLS